MQSTSWPYLQFPVNENNTQAIKVYIVDNACVNNSTAEHGSSHDNDNSDEDEDQQQQVANTKSIELGSFTWPSSIVLAIYIYEHLISSVKQEYNFILELGAGVSALPTALCQQLITRQCCPGLFPLATIAVATDCTSIVKQQHALFFTSNNTNNTATTVMLPSQQLVLPPLPPKLTELNWGEFNLEQWPMPPAKSGSTLILASDCLYETEYFEPLIATIAYYLTLCNNNNSMALVTYHERCDNRSIVYLLHKWDLQASMALDKNGNKFELSHDSLIKYVHGYSSGTLEHMYEQCSSSVKILVIKPKQQVKK